MYCRNVTLETFTKCQVIKEIEFVNGTAEVNVIYEIFSDKKFSRFTKRHLTSIFRINLSFPWSPLKQIIDESKRIDNEVDNLYDSVKSIYGPSYSDNIDMSEIQNYVRETESTLDGMQIQSRMSRTGENGEFLRHVDVYLKNRSAFDKVLEKISTGEEKATKIAIQIANQLPTAEEQSQRFFIFKTILETEADLITSEEMRQMYEKRFEPKPEIKYYASAPKYVS